jgi:hypothetical protein
LPTASGEEQAGLTMAANMTNEELLELKAVP